MQTTTPPKATLPAVLALSAVLCAALPVALPGAARAQDLNDPAEIVGARHGYMLMMAMSLAPLGTMAKGNTPYDAAAAKSAAANLTALAGLDTSMLWVPGTETGVAEDSFALPEILSNADDRNAKFAALRTAAATLADAAGTDAGALKAAMGAVGTACGECHKQYRKPE
jgi:cytochrome c556